jgi:hypothetical protein
MAKVLLELKGINKWNFIENQLLSKFSEKFWEYETCLNQISKKKIKYTNEMITLVQLQIMVIEII